MSIVDRVNRLVLGRLAAGRAGPAVEGDAIRIGSETVPLAGLSGAVAHEVDVHAGALVALTLALRDGRSVTVTQADDCWDGLLAALDRLGLTAAPSRDWTTAVLAGGGKGTPIVLRRDGRPSG